MPCLPSDDRLRVTSVDKIRRSSDRSDAYEIECRLVYEGAAATHLAVWAPFDN